MIWLRSLAFNVGFWTWTAGLGVLALPVLLLPPRWAGRLGRLWACGTLVWLRWTVRLDHRVVGSQHLPPGPAIVASKHQSAWDTLVFAALLRNPAYVHKKELIWLPFVGWYLARNRSIPVDRGGGAKALRAMLASARQRAAEGRVILIFPEGTRTAPGQAKPYHPGVAALYAGLGLPVVPVSLDSGHFWPRRGFVKRPGTITLQVLPPIPPGLDRKAFMARLRADIEEAGRPIGRPAPAATE
jgi:1-acyl-sn-glycerol-3-phosphate acyltransferase